MLLRPLMPLLRRSAFGLQLFRSGLQRLKTEVGETAVSNSERGLTSMCGSAKLRLRVSPLTSQRFCSAIREAGASRYQLAALFCVSPVLLKQLLLRGSPEGAVCWWQKSTFSARFKPRRGGSKQASMPPRRGCVALHTSLMLRTTSACSLKRQFLKVVAAF